MDSLHPALYKNKVVKLAINDDDERRLPNGAADWRPENTKPRNKNTKYLFHKDATRR
jgi:hypothetical protein